MSTTTNATSNSTHIEQVLPFSKLWRVGLMAAVGASSINLVYFLVTKSMFGITYSIPIGGSGPMTPLPALLIIIFNVVPAIGATILLAMLGRYSSRPFRVFWIISVGVFVISFMLPLGLPSSVETSTKICLSLMHIPAGAIILGILSRWGREK